MPIPGIDKNIRELLDRTAEVYSDKTAIHFIDENVKVSYQELNKNVNKYGNSLLSAGLNKGDHVAVMLPNCVEFPFIWLAIAKIGAVMVPVNVRYQPDDLRYVLNDSDANAMVIHSDVLPILQIVISDCPKIKKVLYVGEETDMSVGIISRLKKASTDELPEIDLSYDDLVNIQYTSGTTGFPKGCMLTHEYWLTMGKILSENINENDIFMSVQPFYYMDPQGQLIMSLTAGITFVLAKKYSPSKYMELVRKHGVTCSLAVRAILIYKQPESTLDRENELRYVTIFGFPPDLHKSFEKRFNVVAREGYGMTEIGSCMRVPIEAYKMTGSGSVGKPLAHREVRIVDGKGADVPRGTKGELLVKGPGLFKGYYNKPPETSKAFCGDWFRTGDRFKQDENGYYYIVGRIKDMVRRHGENISASEVENVINSHPKVMDSAVVPVPDDVTDEEVKAYVILISGENEESVPPEDIISYCSERIAKFKVPRFIEYKKAFPRTSSEKVEKHKLIADKNDLRTGSYDAKEQRWLS